MVLSMNKSIGHAVGACADSSASVSFFGFVYSAFTGVLYFFYYYFYFMPRA